MTRDYNDPSRAVGTMLRTAVTAVFFASGAASLILQVVWFKQMQLVLGSSTLSVSPRSSSEKAAIAASNRWRSCMTERAFWESFQRFGSSASLFSSLRRAIEVSQSKMPPQEREGVFDLIDRGLRFCTHGDVSENQLKQRGRRRLRGGIRYKMGDFSRDRQLEAVCRHRLR